MPNVTDQEPHPALASPLVMIVAFGVLPALLAGAFISYRSVVQEVEQEPAFCARCHASRSQYLLWTGSAHKKVACQQCHPMKGADAARLLQSFVLRGQVERAPGAEPLHKAPVPQRTCIRCHLEETADWPQIRASVGHKVHLKAPKVGCLDCHARTIHRFDSAQDACGKCHKEHVDPSSRMGRLHCNACHNFLGGSLIPKRNICRECHVSEGVDAPAFPDNVHMARLPCGACHQPHKARRPNSGTCLGCHEKIARHGLHESRGHGRCADCHRAHQWQTSNADCLRCHQKRSASCASHNCIKCHSMKQSRSRRSP